MGTYTAKGAVSLTWLVEEAAKTKKKIKYYVVERGFSKVLIRYVTPAGNVTNGKGKRYNLRDARRSIPRFTNYWHAYAYMLRQQQAEQEVESKW
jgi:hypothetical protein